MTTRTDVSVDFVPSPRIAVVAAPSTEFNAQDIVDTLRIEEFSWRGQSEDKLLNASGKESLGGGVQVGITVELQDTQIAFEGRTTPAQTGTVTTASDPPVSGLIKLIDTAAAFQTNNIARGSLVINFTDGSIAEVYSVDSEIQLTTRTLVNGTDNSFDVNDAYHVYNVEQCEVLGGNVVAVDDIGSELSAIMPTAFTQVVKVGSSSATLLTTEGAIPSAEQNATAVWDFGMPPGVPTPNTTGRHLIEAGLQDGSVWLDALEGSDAQVGTSTLPVKTFTQARTVLTDFQLKRIRVVNMVSGQLNVDLDGVEVTADNSLGNAVLDLNGQSVANTQFTGISLTGDIFLGSPPSPGISCRASLLYSPMSNLGGTLSSCGFVCQPDEAFQLRTMQTTFINCYASFVENGSSVSPRFDCSSQGMGSPLGSPPIIGSPMGEPVNVSFRNWNGSIEILGVDNVDSRIEIEANSGSVTLASSCIAGTIVVRGNCELIDNTRDAIPQSITIIDERAGNGDLNEKTAEAIWSMNPASSAPPLGTAARFQIEAGFQDGAVWLDTVDGLDTNEGTVSQPVRTFDQAKLVLLDYGLKRLRIAALTDSTLSVNLDGIQVIADDNLRDFVLSFNGESVSGSYFEGFGLTGSIGEVPNTRILHYPMNETTGTNVPDISGQGNNGTTQNMDDTNWVAGKLNNALSFNGVNEWVDSGTAGNFDTTDQFSIEYWTKMTTPASAGVTASKTVTGLFTITGWYIQQNADGSVRWTLRNGFFFQRARITTDIADPGFISVADGNWHHVVCTHDGTGTTAGMDVWVDGFKQAVVVDTDALPGSILNGGNSNIGRRSDGVYYDGLLDEVLFYDEVLPSIQIAQRYNSGAGTESTGLVPVVSSAKSTFHSPMTGIAGLFTDCGFICNADESFKLRPIPTSFVNCYVASVEAGNPVPPRFDVSSEIVGSPPGSPIVFPLGSPTIGSPPAESPVGEPINVAFRNWNGSIEIFGLNNPDSRVEVEATGSVTLSSSCIKGTIVVRGNCELIDITSGATVIDQRAGFADVIAEEIWSYHPASSAPPLGTAARFQIESGFQDGAVWLDGVIGLDTNEGTVSQPVRTFDQAKVVLLDYGMRRLRVVALTDPTLPVGFEGYQVIADENLRDFVLDLNSQALSGSYFEGLGITGSIGETIDTRILHYPMNETSGTNVPDISGQGNNGTTQNMDNTNWVPGKLNNALSFNGVDEWVDSGTAGNFDTTDAFTIEQWIRTTASPPVAGVIASKTVTGIFTITGWYIQQNANGSVRWTLRNGFFFQRARITTDPADPNFINVADGNWHHIVCTHDGTGTTAGMAVWVDSVKQIVTVDTDNLPGSILNGGNSNIGRRSDGVYFQGVIDEVLFYQGVLEPTRIGQRYNNGVGTESVGLVPDVSSAKSTFYSPMSGLAGTFTDCGFVCDANESFKVQPADVGSPVGSPSVGSIIPTSFTNCYVASVEQGNPVPPRFDLSGTNIDVVFRNWSGSIEIIGLDDADSRVEIEATTGVVTLADTCVAGTIVVRGDCDLIDNTTGATVIDQRFTLKTVLEILKYDRNRTRIDKNLFTLTVYDDDGVTPIRVFDLKDDNGVASITQIFERLPQTASP